LSFWGAAFAFGFFGKKLGDALCGVASNSHIPVEDALMGSEF